MKVTNEQEDLSALLQRLRQGTLPRDDIYHAIHELGRAEFVEAVPHIEPFLAHEDPQYRYVALEVLTNHFGLYAHWASAAQALRHDPNIRVRIGAASALGNLMTNTKDAATLRELARTVMNRKEEESVRQTAWRAMLSVIDFNPREQLRLARHGANLENGVDWKLVHKYLPPDER